VPRVISEELVGCGLAVQWEEVPDVDPTDGQPRHAADGTPKTTRRAVIIIVDENPLYRHITRIPLHEQGRQAVIEGLTGGIVIPGFEVVKH
jgi:hypothetical protein